MNIENNSLNNNQDIEKKTNVRNKISGNKDSSLKETKKNPDIEKKLALDIEKKLAILESKTEYTVQFKESLYKLGLYIETLSEPYKNGLEEILNKSLTKKQSHEAKII